jgi:ElaB/YqjD/DUF883 family membrane-anchored ribosome-binding protein
MERTGRWEGGPNGPEGPTPSVDDGIDTGVDWGVDTEHAVGYQGDARSSVREKTERVKQRAKEMSTELKETAGQKAEELKERAVHKTDELTSRAGGRMETIARALRRAGDDMRNEGEPQIADMTDRAASRIERFGSYLEGHDTHAMIGDLERSAKDHPAYFVAATFAVGLLIGRFLRSGEPSAFEGTP